MPNFPIVDTHLHIWDLKRLRYPWLPNVPKLNRDHLIEEYRQACGPVQVAKMVFLQCEADFALFQEEADWVTEVARIDPRIRGIMPWAPLEKGDAAEADLACGDEQTHLRPHARAGAAPQRAERAFHGHEVIALIDLAHGRRVR